MEESSFEPPLFLLMEMKYCWFQISAANLFPISNYSNMYLKWQIYGCNVIGFLRWYKNVYQLNQYSLKSSNWHLFYHIRDYRLMSSVVFFGPCPVIAHQMAKIRMLSLRKHKNFKRNIWYPKLWGTLLVQQSDVNSKAGIAMFIRVTHIYRNFLQLHTYNLRPSS